MREAVVAWRLLGGRTPAAAEAVRDQRLAPAHLDAYAPAHFLFLGCAAVAEAGASLFIAARRFLPEAWPFRHRRSATPSPIATSPGAV